MVKLRIDNRQVTAAEGTTILEAARAAGIAIPAMCNNSDSGHFASCMVCLVSERNSGSMIPACSAMAGEGMDIITSDPGIAVSRKMALELLLSEHTGDCEGPCRISCPAGMDIPLMNTFLAAGMTDKALETVMNHIAFPSVLGRICPAPCEGACHRKGIDAPVSICALKGFAGDNGNRTFAPSPARQGRVAIVGAGIAGLSAAYYLRLKGISCELFDSSPLPGGALRHLADKGKLDRRVLEREISFILGSGVQFHPGTTVDKSRFTGLVLGYDAVVVATGNFSEDISDWGLTNNGKQVSVDKQSLQTSIANVFAAGNVNRSTRLAVRSAGQGRAVAGSIARMLEGREPAGPKQFNSRVGRLREAEHAIYMKEASAGARVEPTNGRAEGYSHGEAAREAARCMHCECLKPGGCTLRDLAGSHGASQRRFGYEERKTIKKSLEHDLVAHEPGKCIKCGICVRLAAGNGERPGLSYLGRGYDVEIAVPFEESISGAINKSGALLARSCPTGALSLKAPRPAAPGRMNLFTAPFLMLLAMLSLLPVHATRPQADGWQNFRGDARLTGATGQTIPASPKPLWTFETGDEIKASPVIYNSRIVIGAGNGVVYCLGMEGNLLWQFDTGNTIEAPALISHNRVYIGNLGGTLFCLDLLSGDMLWRYECDNQIMAAPNIWNRGPREMILVGSYDYYLHAVDALDGSPLWKYELHNYLNSAVAIENDMAVFGGCDGYLHRVDLKGGDPLPEIEIASYVAGSPALENGTAFIGDYDGVFTAVDYLQGKILWTWQDAGRNLPFVSSPSIHGNRVIIGNRDRFVYSLDKRTGEIQWKTNTGSRVDASAVTDGQRVLVANMRGDILLLDIETGKRSWTFETGSPVSGSPGVSEGKIIVGTGDGTIWCFGE
jgi:outer membrane protein assembly factor BamB